MKISVIIAHPHEGSFNHAIANTVIATLKKNRHIISFHDLYAEKFDPILPFQEIQRDSNLDPVINKHCIEIAEAEGIIIIHPNWWGQPPAILKGWIDRVMRVGIAYQFLEGDNGEGVPDGLLKAKTAIIFNTSNTPPRREQEIFGDPLENLWKNCIFEFCGVLEFHRRIFSVVVTSTERMREEWLEEVRDMIEHIFH